MASGTFDRRHPSRCRGDAWGQPRGLRPAFAPDPLDDVAEVTGADLSDALPVEQETISYEDKTYVLPFDVHAARGAPEALGLTNR